MDHDGLIEPPNSLDVLVVADGVPGSLDVLGASVVSAVESDSVVVVDGAVAELEVPVSGVVEASSQSEVGVAQRNLVPEIPVLGVVDVDLVEQQDTVVGEGVGHSDLRSVDLPVSSSVRQSVGTVVVTDGVVASEDLVRVDRSDHSADDFVRPDISFGVETEIGAHRSDVSVFQHGFHVSAVSDVGVRV